MLELLNDDCWLELNKYLNLDDQIALYEASKGVSNRLQSKVLFAWQQQRCFELGVDNYEKFDEIPELLDAFLSSTHATMHELKLRFVNMEVLQRWPNYTFPNINSLDYDLDYCVLERYLADMVLQMIGKIFPGLRSLKPEGNFDIELLSNFRQLRKLDLSECSWTCRRDGWPPFPLLEELTVCYSIHCVKMFHDLLEFPKLHTISFYACDNDDMLAEMLDKRGNDVDTIIFNDCIWEFNISTLRKLTNLRRLTLLEDGYTSENLLSLIACLKQLEQIDLVDLQLWSGEAELWQIIACCPSLKILNISGMHLYEDFFEFDRRDMEKALNNRSKPLRLHCHNTGDHEEKIRQHFKHPQLKLSFKPLPLHYIETSYLQIHLKR